MIQEYGVRAYVCTFCYTYVYGASEGTDMKRMIGTGDITDWLEDQTWKPRTPVRVLQSLLYAPVFGNHTCGLHMCVVHMCGVRMCVYFPPFPHVWSTHLWKMGNGICTWAGLFRNMQPPGKIHHAGIRTGDPEYTHVESVIHICGAVHTWARGTHVWSTHLWAAQTHMCTGPYAYVYFGCAGGPGVHICGKCAHMRCQPAC